VILDLNERCRGLRQTLDTVPQSTKDDSSKYATPSQSSYIFSIIFAEILDTQIQLKSVNLKSILGKSPLSSAARKGSEAGRTALSWAAEIGQEEVMKLLLLHKDVDVSSEDRYGRTPLLWAAAGGHEAVVKLLLTRDNIDVSSKDGLGRTPLLWARLGRHMAVVELLLAHHSDE